MAVLMFWAVVESFAAPAVPPAPVAPPESAAESTHDRWASMKDLSIEPTLIRPLSAPVRLALGPQILELADGFLVPIFSGHLDGDWDEGGKRWLAEQEEGEAPRLPSADERGDQALVGWVWSGGTGQVTVPLADRADAEILANRMVMDLEGDRATWAPVAHGEAPLRSAVELAVVVGVAPEIRAAFVGEAELDPYEVVVFGATGAAGRRAADALRSRQRVWEELERDLGGRVAWDRLGIERGAVDPHGTFTAWDLLTSTRYGLVAPQLGGEDDRWLAVIRDTTGEIDQRREIRVASLGAAPSGGTVDGLVGGVPHPPSVDGEPTSAPLPRVRVDAVEADSVVTVAQTPNGLDLAVTVTSRLTFRAVGGPAAWIDLRFPKMERRPGTFRFVEIALPDGTPLLGRAEEDVKKFGAPDPEPEPDPSPEPKPPEPEPPPEAGEARIRLHLPTPLAAGETVVIKAVHEDTWPYAVFAGGPLGTVALGASSGLQAFLPAVQPHAFGSPWRFHAQVAVPEVSKLTASVSGRTTSEREEKGWRVVEVDSEDHVAWWPSIAVGRYTTIDDPASDGLPAVRVRAFNTHFGTIEHFAPEARRVVKFFEGYLPQYPVREVEVFEAPARFDGFVWIAPHGMVNLQMMLVTTLTGTSVRDEPHLEAAVFAHELAHQYWGHLAPPATSEDFWISESFAELFACMYVSAAYDTKDCALRMAHKRERWEASGAPKVPASLSRAYSSSAQPAIVYDYGPYVLGEMLIRRIGRQAFFSAMDVMLREHPYEPVTTERIESYLSLASGASLGPFFDTWVHGGRLPALALEWKIEGRTLTGTVTADIPFGSFDVPVVVRSKDSASIVSVAVTDGVGAFTVEVPSPKVEVALDPDGYVLASARVVRQGGR